MKTQRNTSRLGRNAVREEVVRWANSHDVFDRLKRGYLRSARIAAIWTKFFGNAIFQENDRTAEYALAAGNEGHAYHGRAVIDLRGGAA